MTNFEKYYSEIKYITEQNESFGLYKGKLTRCLLTPCENCEFYMIYYSCSHSRIKWLLEEYKEPIKLTTKEKAFLSKPLFPTAKITLLPHDLNGRKS